MPLGRKRTCRVGQPFPAPSAVTAKDERADWMMPPRSLARCVEKRILRPHNKRLLISGLLLLSRTREGAWNPPPETLRSVEGVRDAVRKGWQTRARILSYLGTFW